MYGPQARTRGRTCVRVTAVYALAAAVALTTSLPVCAADEPTLFERIALKPSGFANLTPGGLSQQARIPDASSVGLVPEVEIEINPQVKAGGATWAARVAFNASGVWLDSEDTWQASIPEASAFVVSKWGRFEAGERAAFPQTLVGYAPAEIAFTSAGFGPESGARLDPDGRLPTSFLSAGLASRIDGLTYLGYAERFYRIRSPKVIYVSPRWHGLWAAASWSPETVRPDAVAVARTQDRPPAPGDPFEVPTSDDADLEHLVQAGAVFQHRTEDLDLTVGLTYGHAEPDERADGERTNASSLSAGATLTVRDTITAGVSATVDGLTEPGDPRTDEPYGVVASLDIVEGPWVAGGYYQFARRTSAGETGADSVHVAEIGASYLFDEHDLLGEGRYTDIKIYTSAYYYRFANAQPTQPDRGSEGVVLLAGAQFSFF